MKEEKAPPVADPGLEEHEHRFTDVDEAAADRAYRQIVGMLASVPVFVLAFLFVYFGVSKDAELVLFGANFKMQTTLLGLTGGLATLMIGVAAIAWARSLMSDEEIVGESATAPRPHWKPASGCWPTWRRASRAPASAAASCSARAWPVPSA